MSNIPPERGNRIEVDLRLLQDRNLDMLNDFAKRFETSVLKLEKVAEAGFGIGGVGTFGSVEESASTAEKARQAVSGSQGDVAAAVTQALNAPASPSQSESRAKTIAPEDLSKYAWAPGQGGPWRPSNLMGSSYANIPGSYGGNEWERAQFSLGSLSPGIVSGLQYASFLTGQHGARFEDPKMWARDASGNLVLDANGNVIYEGNQPSLLGLQGKRWAQASGAFGGLARGAIWGQQVGGQFLRALPFGLNPQYMNTMALQGIGVGNYDTSGWMGTPFMSSGWKTGIGQQWDAWTASRWGGLTVNPLKGFGLLGDPNYSRQQALEAQQLMTDYGWNNDLRDGGLDVMARYTRKYKGAFSQQYMMDMLDPIMRTGSGNVGQVANVLDSLAQSARAANVNLQKFAEQALNAGQAISGQTGMSLYRATRAAGDIMGVTGLGAGAAQEIMTNDLYMYLGASNSPYGIAGMLYGEGAAGRRMGAMLDVADPSRRGFSDPNRWRGYKWGRDISEQSPEHIQLMNEFAWAQKAGMVPQDITFDEWANMMRRSLKSGVSVEDALNGQATLNLGVDKSARIERSREALEKQAIKKGLGGMSAQEWRDMPDWARDKFLDKITENRAYGAVGASMKKAGFGKEWNAARRLEQLGYNFDQGDPTETSYLRGAGRGKSKEEIAEIQRLAKRMKPYEDLIKGRGGSIDNTEDARAFAEGVAKEAFGKAGDEIAKDTIELTVKQPYGEMFEALIKKSKNTQSGNSSGFFARASGAVGDLFD